MNEASDNAPHVPRPSARPRSIFPIVVLLLVCALGLLVFLIPFPEKRHVTRAKVSRVRADLRTMATALAAYRADHDGASPSMVPLAEIFDDVEALQRLGAQGHHVAPALTTPIAYLRELFPHGHSTPSIPLLYYRWDSEAALFYGLGPEEQLKIRPQRLAEFDPEDSEAELLDYLLGVSFDPTNGMASSGDLWRLVP